MKSAFKPTNIQALLALLLLLTSAIQILGCTPIIITAKTSTSSSSGGSTDTPSSSFCSGSALTNFPFAGGSGTVGDPYSICTAAQLQALGADSSFWTSYVVLYADIDLSAYVYPGATPFNMIGTFGGTGFTGNFDGNNHTISNFSYVKPASSGIGLFSYVTDGTIKNLTLSNVNLSGSTDVGGLIAYSSNGNTTISNCHVSGTVTGSGLVAGGLVGNIDAGSISNCSSSATVSTGRGAGGLIGKSGATLSASFATGAVSTSSGAGAGGLVASAYGTVTNCYAWGNVTSSSGAGGLIGQATPTFTLALSNSYSIGVVSGSAPSGGLVGIRNSSSDTASFWDTSTSGQATSALGTGEVTSWMKTAANFTGAGWSPAIWNLTDGSYPTLK